LLAGGLAAFLATRGGGEPAPSPDTPVAVVQAATTKVLVAKSNIGVGQRLSADNIAWQDWPQDAAKAQVGFITSDATPKAMTDMSGAVARFELFAGEPILQAKLVRADQGYLSAVLDKGKRGVSINVSADSASGGFIVPNDHVDVILTRNTGQGQTSEPVLTNVRILAINARLGETGTTGAGGDGSDPAADPKSQVFGGGAIATLELTPDQADTIINASQLGKLSLALRSIVDFAPTTADTTGDVVKKNAPIRIIRSGNETSVMAGVGAEGAVEAGGSVAPAAYNEALPVPTTTITTGPQLAAPLQ
jgi:pilus assembly protein CpaB